MIVPTLANEKEPEHEVLADEIIEEVDADAEAEFEEEVEYLQEDMPIEDVVAEHEEGEEDDEEEADEEDDGEEIDVDEDYNPVDNGDNPRSNRNGIILSEMFSFPDGSSADVHEKNLHQAVITEDKRSQKGHMWYKYQVDLDKSFEIESQIYLGSKHFDAKNHDKWGADGLTFVVHNDPKGLDAVGDTGASLGLGLADSSETIKNGIALEFDTYFNTGTDQVDKEIAKKYNYIANTSLAGDNFSSAHLFHVALMQLGLPKKSSFITTTTKTWNNALAKSQEHALTSIFTTTQVAAGRDKRADFGNKSGQANVGSGYTAQVYDGLAIEDVFSRWHDLKISWDAESYTLRYEIGNGSENVHAVEEYTLSGGESRLNSIFGFGSGESKKVYWGFTGSTGSYFNYQSVAMHKLPYYIEAEVSKEGKAGGREDEGGYGTGILEGVFGDALSYRSEVKIEGQNSDIPLAGVQFEDALDGVELTGDIEVQWRDSESNITRTEIIRNEDIITDRNFEARDELTAYLTQNASGQQILHITGIGTLGEHDYNIVSEALTVTYDARITHTDGGLINDTSAVFRSGTRAEMRTEAVPVQAQELIEGELEFNKQVDTETARPGDILVYTLKLENKTNKAWEGRIEDELDGMLKFAEGYTADQVIISGDTEIEVSLEEDKLSTEVFVLQAGEELNIVFEAELTAEVGGGSIVENTAVWIENNESGRTVSSNTVITESLGEPGVLQLVVPEIIGFGSVRISPAEEKYEIDTMIFEDQEADAIAVVDTREEKYNWNLVVGLESPFRDAENRVTYDRALIYNNGNKDEVLSVDNMTTVLQMRDNTETMTNISEGWYENGNASGLFLRFAPGQGRIGTYSAAIRWELQDVPGND